MWLSTTDGHRRILNNHLLIFQIYKCSTIHIHMYIAHHLSVEFVYFHHTIMVRAARQTRHYRLYIRGGSIRAAVVKKNSRHDL